MIPSKDLGLSAALSRGMHRGTFALVVGTSDTLVAGLSAPLHPILLSIFCGTFAAGAGTPTASYVWVPGRDSLLSPLVLWPSSPVPRVGLVDYRIFFTGALHVASGYAFGFRTLLPYLGYLVKYIPVVGTWAHGLIRPAAKYAGIHRGTFGSVFGTSGMRVTGLPVLLHPTHPSLPLVAELLQLLPVR